MALYDPREFPAETVSPDFTVADVLAWARTKPADEVYDYGNPGDCALCQFLKETGQTRQGGSIGERYWTDLTGKVRYIPTDLNAAADGGGAEWTFGALVKRLEAL
jgi:hypothetical protein